MFSYALTFSFHHKTGKKLHGDSRDWMETKLDRDDMEKDREGKKGCHVSALQEKLNPLGKQPLPSGGLS